MCPPLDYKKSGVDIELGNELVNDYKKIVKSTHNSSVLNQLGGFCALYDLSDYNLKQPVLVSATDGVGTKLRLALDWDQHSGVGIDLVAMCVNDLIVIGAKPLFFLDYYASGKLDKNITLNVVQSIANGCKQANIALVGGETAEMPGMYHGKDYDLAGFCVGLVDKSEIIDGRDVETGDALIALPSSGMHSNGFSLVRKILEQDSQYEHTEIAGQSIKDILLEPTRIYTKALAALQSEKLMKGAAHITGGGLTENIPRFLSENSSAHIDINSWQLPGIFQWLQEKSKMSHADLRLTFNCGVGMVVCVAASEKEHALALLESQGEKAWVIGHIIEKPGTASVEYSDES
tara:strand:+ start:89489 stop:90529 length:1041 start_codon:yes stop_codon:yes gene_type:complete